MPKTRKHGDRSSDQNGLASPSRFWEQAEKSRIEVAHVARLARREMQAKEREEARNPNPLDIRPMCIDDASYVIDSWVKSYRKCLTALPVEQDVYNIEQRARIDRLISRSKCFVACDSVQRTEIRGWICFEPPSYPGQVPMVHYVCVHPAHQLLGIATALVNIARNTCEDKEAWLWATHETQPMKHIREKWKLLYNPYLLEVAIAAPEAAKKAKALRHGT